MIFDINQLRNWIGRTETTDDMVTLAPLQALTATLDRNDPPALGEPVPACWHWLYFQPVTRHSELGPDGHPQRGGFLPPVPLPRRMWAGSHIQWLAPLRVGHSLQRQS